MTAYRLRLPVIFSLLSVTLGGCAGFEQLAAADATTSVAMVAKADEAAISRGESDELAKGKQFFRDQSFGLAEKSFRRAVESSSSNAEAWLGLAAAHDQLGRYDLADREYQQVEKKSGVSLALLNNRGYSYLMRGDFTRARRDFAAAERLAPDNAFVRNNLRMLDEKLASRS